MSMSINGTSGLVFNDASTQNTAATGFGFKNRLINGAMMIDQRNAGASVTPNNTYTLDRWQGQNSQTSKYTVQQSSTAPTGFKTSLLVTSSSAYSVGSGDYFFLNQPIEGFNTADLGFGASGASTITISFWVRSSLTGTFGGSLRNYAVDRSYPFSYTISVANTWEQKSVTIAGDTSGTWVGATNSVGMYVVFALGAGSTFSGTTGSWTGGNLVSATGATSVVGTSGATFYITGVQLEKGSTATSFDYRPYGTELALCQRYAVVYGGDSVYERICMLDCVTSSATNGTIPLPVQMRTTPSVSVNSLSNFAVYSRNVITTVTSLATQYGSSKVLAVEPLASGFTVGSAGQLLTNNTIAARLTLSAEL